MNSKKENNFQSQGGNPTGFLGFVIGKLMNIFHSNSYKLGLSKILKERLRNIQKINAGLDTVLKGRLKMVERFMWFVVIKKIVI